MGFQPFIPAYLLSAAPTARLRTARLRTARLRTARLRTARLRTGGSAQAWAANKRVLRLFVRARDLFPTPTALNNLAQEVKAENAEGHLAATLGCLETKKGPVTVTTRGRQHN